MTPRKDKPTPRNGGRKTPQEIRTPIAFEPPNADATRAAIIVGCLSRAVQLARDAKISLHGFVSLVEHVWLAWKQPGGPALEVVRSLYSLAEAAPRAHLKPCAHAINPAGLSCDEYHCEHFAPGRGCLCAYCAVAFGAERRPASETPTAFNGAAPSPEGIGAESPPRARGHEPAGKARAARRSAARKA
jgi:hypothetical protein